MPAATLAVLVLVATNCGGVPAAPSAPAAPITPRATPGPATPSPPSATSSAIAAPIPDMCTVLTAADVTRITGRPATINPQSRARNCNFSVGDAQALLPEYIVDFRVDDPAGADLGQVKARWRGRDVADVGDSAYWAPGVSVLWFTRGGTTYAVQLVLFGADDGDPLEVARGLALAALSRL